MRRFPVQLAIAALLVPLAANSVALTIAASRWKRSCFSPLFIIDGKEAEFILSCRTDAPITRLLSGLATAELVLHLSLAMLISIGLATYSFPHRQTSGAAIRVGSLFPFATLLPFGTPRWSQLYVPPPKRFDPSTWNFVWHVNHQRVFWVVAMLQVVAAMLWVTRSWPTRHVSVLHNPDAMESEVGT